MESDTKYLGKIDRATLGHDGDGRFGITLSFSAGSYGVSTFVGAWASPPSEYAKWTVEDQMREYAGCMVLIRDTLAKAKRKTVEQLVGIPVEIVFEHGMLKSWRVLEEVI